MYHLSPDLSRESETNVPVKRVNTPGVGVFTLVEGSGVDDYGNVPPIQKYLNP